MSDEFIGYVKSTIDRAGVDIALAYGDGVKFMDLDNVVDVAEVQAGSDGAIVWTMLSLDEAPRAPMYLIRFGIGAKTTLDAGSYTMAALLDAVKSVMKKGATMELRDYTPGGDGTTHRGTMTFSDISVNEQLFDKASGLRLISVTAMAVDDG
jgi:hypothetical protein